MSTSKLLRASALSLAIAALLAAPSAFAQDQQGYAQNNAAPVQTQETAAQPPQIAKAPSDAASIVRPADDTAVTRAPSTTCKDAAGVTHYGLTAQGGFGGHCW